MSITKELEDLIFYALNHGIESIKDGNGPLVPFLMSEGDTIVSNRTLSRFVADTYPDSVLLAKNAVKQLPENVCRYAVAFDTTLTINNKKYDAIVVESANRLDNVGYIYIQKYRGRGFFSKFRTIDKPLYCDTTRSLFIDDNNSDQIYFDNNNEPYMQSIELEEENSNLKRLLVFIGCGNIEQFDKTIKLSISNIILKYKKDPGFSGIIEYKLIPTLTPQETIFKERALELENYIKQEIVENCLINKNSDLWRISIKWDENT